MPSETTAEEIGMAQHIADNEDQIMTDRAMCLAGKIRHMMAQAGLGSVSEDEIPVLARHLLAVKTELDPFKPWNQ